MYYVLKMRFSYAVPHLVELAFLNDMQLFSSYQCKNERYRMPDATIFNKIYVFDLQPSVYFRYI